MPGVKEDGTPNDVYTSATNSDEAPFGINASPGNYIYDATFVKLREVNLTYSFKNILFANSKFVKGIDLSLVGRNLAILYKDLPYADPEQSYSAGNLSGHSGGTYPAVKTIGFNLRLKF